MLSSTKPSEEYPPLRSKRDPERGRTDKGGDLKGLHVIARLREDHREKKRKKMHALRREQNLQPTERYGAATAAKASIMKGTERDEGLTSSVRKDGTRQERSVPCKTMQSLSPWLSQALRLQHEEVPCSLGMPGCLGRMPEREATPIQEQNRQSSPRRNLRIRAAMQQVAGRLSSQHP